MPDGMYIKSVADALKRKQQMQPTAENLLAELEAIVAGWDGIADGLVRGRQLTPWEIERRTFAKQAIAQAKEVLYE